MVEFFFADILAIFTVLHTLIIFYSVDFYIFFIFHAFQVQAQSAGGGL